MFVLRPRHQRGGMRGPPMPWGKSPTPPTAPPALTPAAAATTIAKVLHATRGEEPESKTSWAEFEAQYKKNESENLQANKEIELNCNVREHHNTNVDTTPVSPKTPLRIAQPFRARREGRNWRTASPPHQSRHPRGRRASLQKSFRGRYPRTPLPLSHGHLNCVTSKSRAARFLACFVDCLVLYPI